MNLQAELSYFKPYFYNADTSLMSKVFYRDFGSYQVPLAIERRVGAEATVAHRMKYNKHVTGTFSLGIEHIDVSEGDGKKSAAYTQIQYSDFRTRKTIGRRLIPVFKSRFALRYT